MNIERLAIFVWKFPARLSSTMRSKFICSTHLLQCEQLRHAPGVYILLAGYISGTSEPRTKIMKKHANKTDRVVGRSLFQHRLATPAFIILLIGIVSSLAWIQFHQKRLLPNAVAAVEPPAFKPPETLNGLLAMSPTELEHCDIARMNLVCAAPQQSPSFIF